MYSKNNVVVIGSGFAGLSAACFLAKEGYDVAIVEKNSKPGGRARNFLSNGFTFDMGPSWYWMNDVFERFFNQFGKSVSNLYSLTRLDPSYRIYWASEKYTDVSANYESLKDTFEKIEPGSAVKLDSFLKEAEYKYTTAMKDMVYFPSLSIREYFDKRLLFALFRLGMISSISSHIKKHFTNPYIVQMLEFPAMFLGSIPKKTPALYSLLNYADIKLGTWYPEGGMYTIVQKIYELARSLGIKFYFNTEVTNFTINENRIVSLSTNNGQIETNIVISAADYQHIEKKLPIEYQNYSNAYWHKRILAPSALIYYLGFNIKLNRLLHHTLFFDRPFDKHANEIYLTPRFPSEPLLYLSVTSKTDPNTAPLGCENVFVLIPVASGLNDTLEIREKYFNEVINRLENVTGQNIKKHIIFRRDYGISDFKSDYNAFQGNAYGLANTLFQTAVFKPKIINKKIKNLFYTGQMTVPGPGVPPALISGEIVAKYIINKQK